MPGCRSAQKSGTADKKRLWVRWGAVALLTLVLWGMGQLLILMIQKAGGNIGRVDPAYTVLDFVKNLTDWARMLAFAAALAETLRHVKRKKV